MEQLRIDQQKKATESLLKNSINNKRYLFIQYYFQKASFMSLFLHVVVLSAWTTEEMPAIAIKLFRRELNN
jgi:hypothetical protein